MLGGDSVEGEEVELWGQCYNIEETDSLDLGGNQLFGEIPSEIFNLTNLTELELGGNQFSGEIPSELWNLTNLTYLNLVHNQFSETIPSNICTLNLNWNNPDNFNIHESPPYPECIEYYTGYQYTTNCSSMSISELTQPIEYNLKQPFPNPFNPTISILFSIPEQSKTLIKVYDIKGNMISTLLNKPMNVGHHQIEWNGENQSSGTYFIKIKSDEFSDVKKVVLVK